jgi:hypothetical protein
LSRIVNHHGAHQHLGVVDRALADHTDIQRVAITALAARRELSDPVAAVGNP